MRFIHLHIINKNSVAGGIENLVYRIEQHKIEWPETQHKIFKIAPNKLMVFLFSRQKLRKLVLLVALLRLVIIFSMYKFHLRLKVNFIYHTAEAHFLLYLFLKLTRSFSSINSIVYFHQSPALYPKKIFRYTSELFRDVRLTFILYSSQLLREWPVNAEAKKFIIHAAPRSPSFKSINKFSKPYILFVGRDVEWKGLDLAIKFTKEISYFIPKITLLVVGGNAINLRKKWSPQLSQNCVKFLGNQNLPPYQNSLFFLSPSDFSKSLESFGIAGLESISYGVPIVTRDNATSDYNSLPGIYTVSDIKYILHKSKNSNDAISKLLNLQLNDAQKKYWELELSFERYINDLNKVLNNTGKILKN